MKHFTCQEGEVCRTGDGEVRRCDIQGFDSIHGHFVEVWSVDIAVVIPPETIEGDQQHSLSLFVYRSSDDGQSPEEAETCSPQHGEHRHFTDLNWLSSSWNSYLQEEPPLGISPEVSEANSFWAKFHQFILSLRLDGLYLSTFLHAAQWCLWADFTAGSCVHSEFSPVLLLRTASKAD